VILLRPTIVAGGRQLYQVVAVHNGQGRVISPPLSKKEAVSLAAWAASKGAAYFIKAGV